MAADALQVEVRYYTVKTEEDEMCTASVLPTGGRTPKACLRLALELDRHYCAIEEVESREQGTTTGERVEPNMRLITRAEEREMRERAYATAGAAEGGLASEVSEREDSTLGAIVPRDGELDGPSDGGYWRYDARAGEWVNDEDAGLAVRFARREVINELKDHLTRREEGSEADALNSERYDGTAAPEGGAERVGARAEAARGPASDMPLTQEVIEHIDSGDGNENDGEEMPGLARAEDSEDEGEYPGAPSTRSRARATDALQAQETTPIAEGECDASTVVVIPYAMTPEGPAVLVPTDETRLLATRVEPNKGGMVEAAEQLVSQLLPSTGRPIGFAAGRREDGAKVVTVATGEPKAPLVRTAEERQGLSKPSLVAIWCTMAAITASTWQTQVAMLAVATASRFSAPDGTMKLWAAKEPRLRSDTGWQAGRVDYQAPIRATVPREGMTARELASGAQLSLEELKHALRNVEGEHANYYREWADAVKPLELGETTSDLLDSPLGLGSELLGGALFSEPLPVYETPWLPRAPPQKRYPREGCNDYRADNALALLDQDAQRELRRWFRDAEKDAACLEARGPDCDRRDTPAAIAIGQDQFHP